MGGCGGVAKFTTLNFRNEVCCSVRRRGAAWGLRRPQLRGLLPVAAAAAARLRPRQANM